MRPKVLSCVVVGSAACVLACSGRPLPGGEGTDSRQAAILSSGAFTFNVPLPPGTPMSDVVLGSNSSILIGSRVQVAVEGSTGARSMISNAGSGTVTTTQTDVILQDNIWSRGDVFLADRTSVAGSVTTAGTLTRQNNVTIGGPILEHQSLTA